MTQIVHHTTHVQEEEAEDRVVRFDRVLDAVDGREGPGGDEHHGVPGQSPHELLHARLLLRRRADGRSFCSVVDSRRKPEKKEKKKNIDIRASTWTLTGGGGDGVGRGIPAFVGLLALELLSSLESIDFRVY